MSNAKLIDLDIEFLLDASGSMVRLDYVGKQSRWQFAVRLCNALVKSAARCVGDGITLSVFNSQFTTFKSLMARKVAARLKKFSPRCDTFMRSVIQSRLDAYFARKADAIKFDASNDEARAKASLKPLRLFILTDNAPIDITAVKEVIVEATKKMDGSGEIVIYFVQVGRDPDAARFFKALASDLGKMGAKFDIVRRLTARQAWQVLTQAPQASADAIVLPLSSHPVKRTLAYADDSQDSSRHFGALCNTVSDIYNTKSDVISLVKTNFPAEVVFECDWRTPKTAVASLVSWCAANKMIHLLVQILLDDGHSVRFGMMLGLLLSAGVIVPVGKTPPIGADESSLARWSSDAAEVDRRGVAKAAQFAFDDMRCFLP